MASPTFEAISAVLFGGAGEYERATPGLSYRARLSHGESIELTTGERFTDLDCSFSVHPDTAPAPPIRGDAVGLIHYHEARSDLDDSFPASCTIQVWVPIKHVDELVAAARHGRIPSKLTVDVEGMDYGALPDGSAKKWDNKTSRYLKVSSFRYELPLFTPVSTNQVQPTASEEGMPPTRAQFEQLGQRIDLHATEIKSGLKALLWVVIVVGTLLFLLRWR